MSSALAQQPVLVGADIGQRADTGPVAEDGDALARRMATIRAPPSGMAPGGPTAIQSAGAGPPRRAALAPPATRWRHATAAKAKPEQR